MTPLNVIDLLLVLFCGITLIVTFTSPCSDGSMCMLPILLLPFCLILVGHENVKGFPRAIRLQELTQQLKSAWILYCWWFVTAYNSCG